jgi:hypothetical protein
MKGNRIFLGMAFLAMMVFMGYPAQSGSLARPMQAQPVQVQPAHDTNRPLQPLPPVPAQVVPAVDFNRPAQPLPPVPAQVVPAVDFNRPLQPLPLAKSSTRYVSEREGEEHEGEMHDYDYYPGYGYGYYPGYYDRDWGLGWGWGYPNYWGWGYPYSYYGSRDYQRQELRQLAMAGMGQVDIHVKPGDTQVYVNGRDVGKASQFDGNPGYLWLKAGNYDLAFYENGYQTIDREIHVRPGVEYKIKTKMEHGTATLPQMP